jgi:hypothetical protein
VLESHQKVVLDDLKGKRKVELEVNFSPDPKYKDCVRVMMGSEEAFIPIQDLFGFIFVVANEEQQAEMVPVRHTVVQKYMKQHHVVAKKTIRPGEHLIVNCEIDVPVTIVDAFKNSKIFNQAKFL